MKMLSPLQIGSVEVKNRVVSTAHSAFVDFFQPGNHGEQYMAYQERRAKGGTGLIILTAMHVHYSSQCGNHYNYEEGDLRRKLAQLSTRVHRHGTKLVSQLFHFGAQGKSDTHPDFTPLWGFSGMISASGEASHAMTEEEIEQVIQGFVDSAVIAVESGMDGVELHGTHGYLLQQSFSPWGNQRTDVWGEQLHFAKTVIRRVREAIGPKALLGFRLSSDDFIEPRMGGLGHEGLCKVAAGLVATGHLSYLNHSEGAGNNHYARAIGSYRHPFGQWLPLTHGLRDAIGAAIPVVGVGKIPTPDLAERALENGDCDLVGMTRAQIADPDLVLKLQTRQAHRIRTCTGANQGCIDRTGSLPITCIQNPEVGQEYKLKPLTQVAQPRKVLVIGAGPAGLKAAELAARRGHRVTIADAGEKPGGRLLAAGNDLKSANLLAAISWLEQELKLLGVQIMHRTPVDEAFVRAFAPDAVILAAGATPSRDLGVATDGSIPIISVDEAAEGVLDGQKFELKDARCLMVDRRNSYETCLTTEILAKRGSRVTVATPAFSFGASLGFTHLDDLMTSLPKLGCVFVPSTVLSRVEQGQATLLHIISKQETRQAFDCIVAGVHPKPNTQLYDRLRALCPQVLMAGDVVAPRTALEAFREGDRAGRTV